MSWLHLAAKEKSAFNVASQLQQAKRFVCRRCCIAVGTGSREEEERIVHWVSNRRKTGTSAHVDVLARQSGQLHPATSASI